MEEPLLVSRPYNNSTQKKSSKFESLDYDICENVLWEKEQVTRKPRFKIRKDLDRWIISFYIGVLTALVGCFISISIEEISDLKYSFLQKIVKKNSLSGNLVWPYIVYVLTNVLPVILGSFLVTFVEPVASGSGIPLVKCYLNGIKIPKIVRLRTLLVKASGVVLSVVGGLAGGKEGPMVHCGAVIAAGVSQGKSSSFGRDFNIYRYFRDDHEKRDFVVGGASAGVSAAFGAPIGGLLFSLEEAASFWNQSLIWRTLFSSIVSSFTLNLVLSYYHGHKTTFHGLFNLGEFKSFSFEYYELPIYMLMGCYGGLSGAFWVSMNNKLNKFRERYIKLKIAQVLEAALVAALSASLACLMMYNLQDCKSIGQDPTSTPVQLSCLDNEYNVAAALWFQTPEQSVKSLFHDPPGSHATLTLLVFLPIYFFLSNITYGLGVSLGIFIPSLLVGACWGRLFSTFLSWISPDIVAALDPGKYALIGAAAQLGGTVRMTISLAVIIMETTGNIYFVFPIIITLTTAKWVGDFFNEGIYDTQIMENKVPFLPWQMSIKQVNMRAKQIMSSPVVCVRLSENLEYILHILKETSHNGFPVVDHIDSENRKHGRLRGLILRSQLVIILKNSLFQENMIDWESKISIETFRNEYPRYPNISEINIPKHIPKNMYNINMEIFMNPTPYTVNNSTSVPRIFLLFRALGLRHLIVTDNDNQVTGIITRKNFLK